MKVTINGIEFDVADAPLAQAINQQTDELTRLRQGEIKVGDTAFVLSEIKAVQASVDKLVGDNKVLMGENERLKANQVNAKDIENLVAERVKTIDDAKKINPHVITDGKTVQQIKADIVAQRANDKLVQAIVGDVAIGDVASDKYAQIDMAFKALVATVDSLPALPAMDVALAGLVYGDGGIDVNANGFVAGFDKSSMWQG